MADPTDLEKLSQGAFISEFQKSVAGSPERVRQSADRAWTVAGAIGAVLIAVGFTELLRDASTVVQSAGVCAIVLWLIAAILFLRVSLPARNGQLAANEAAIRTEIGEPPPEASHTKREAWTYLVQTVAMRDFLAARLRVGIGFAVAAIAATGVALAATVFIESDEALRGQILLTPAGQATLATVCPQFETVTTELGDGSTGPSLAELPVGQVEDESKIGGDDPIVLRFAANDCADRAMRIVFDSELVLGVSE